MNVIQYHQMEPNGQVVEIPPQGAHAGEALRHRPTKTLILIAVLFVVVPFLFWRGTWFGRPLNDDEMAKYFSDPKQPRHIQHALVQVGERITRGDPAAARWYPQVLALAASPFAEIRITLAWVLGADNRSREFHDTLHTLLQDSEPLVRRNGALSLVRFGDASGRPEIVSILRPHTVAAASDGKLFVRVNEGNPVDRGTLLARIEGAGGQVTEVRSPFPGSVERRMIADNAQVRSGEPILLLASQSDQVWEALRALYLIGQTDDLAAIEAYLSRSEDVSERIREQANSTTQEIRRRGRTPRDQVPKLGLLKRESDAERFFYFLGRHHVDRIPGTSVE